MSKALAKELEEATGCDWKDYGSRVYKGCKLQLPWGIKGEVLKRAQDLEWTGSVRLGISGSVEIIRAYGSDPVEVGKQVLSELRLGLRTLLAVGDLDGSPLNTLLM